MPKEEFVKKNLALVCVFAAGAALVACGGEQERIGMGEKNAIFEVYRVIESVRTPNGSRWCIDEAMGEMCICTRGATTVRRLISGNSYLFDLGRQWLGRGCIL